MTPKRIQRKRTKGWRMPEGAVYVGRPGRYGNPFVVGTMKFLHNDGDGSVVVADIRDAQEAVAYFRWYVEASEHRLAQIAELRGRDLACWCPLDAPCHADVLLEIANA